MAFFSFRFRWKVGLLSFLLKSSFEKDFFLIWFDLSIFCPSGLAAQYLFQIDSAFGKTGLKLTYF